MSKNLNYWINQRRQRATNKQKLIQRQKVVKEKLQNLPKKFRMKLHNFTKLILMDGSCQISQEILIKLKCLRVYSLAINPSQMCQNLKKDKLSRHYLNSLILIQTQLKAITVKFQHNHQCLTPCISLMLTKMNVIEEEKVENLIQLAEQCITLKINHHPKMILNLLKD